MSGWRRYRKIANVLARQMDAPFTVQTLEGVATGDKGDYLCRGIEGEEWPMRHEKFTATYAPVSSAARSDWQEYRKMEGTVLACRMPEAFTVENSHGTLVGQTGDYLCRDQSGGEWPVKASIFEASYKFIGDQD